MNINPLTPLYTGLWFHFEVTGGTHPLHIEVYIDRVQVLSKDCPDPPCHQMIAIGARGSEVLVFARDAEGNSEERRFKVNTPEKVEERRSEVDDRERVK